MNLTDVLFAIKNIASKTRRMPDAIKTLLENIFEMGRIAEISDFENDDREDLGLPTLPEEPDIEGIRKIFKRTKITELIEESE